MNQIALTVLFPFIVVDSECINQQQQQQTKGPFTMSKQKTYFTICTVCIETDTTTKGSAQKRAEKLRNDGKLRQQIESYLNSKVSKHGFRALNFNIDTNVEE